MKVENQKQRRFIRLYVIQKLDAKGLTLAELCRKSGVNYTRIASAINQREHVCIKTVNEVLQLANYTHRVDFINGDFCEVYKSKL
jgi:lambda repressor-like predicted transcriptional regulator